MSGVIIPLNSFPYDTVKRRGQAWFVEHVAKSGAYGVEIRRELFPEGRFPLKEIRSETEKYNLFIVYSAPIELWLENGTFDKEALQQVFLEAKQLGANWVKVSLGHYKKNTSDFLPLKEFLKSYHSVQLLVENDQTMYGGNIEKLASFFTQATHQQIPVNMTFDTGNWYYTNQDVENALEQLAGHVCYLHFKHVEKQEDELITVPLPNKEDAEWTRILRRFPVNIMKALEFPMDLNGINKYMAQIQHEELQL
ncbi:TIM barrel protein [Gracilibacillus sp. YIM 98692]|uniref:sugar phosphate isomerase/epimerase family protein n=1 Tax=Gracilibacillus sp. YIM 98692 TaxID=2663532 RepID=UPI0013D03CD8|nr:TIM barrel protein [Gracilibacillus sp. YIM 98692]